MNELVKAEGASSQPQTQSSESSALMYTCLSVTKSNGVTKIVLNRPQKKNALTREVYFNCHCKLAIPFSEGSTITGCTRKCQSHF